LLELNDGFALTKRGVERIKSAKQVAAGGKTNNDTNKSKNGNFFEF
jgi:hypothetical protein